ncbi:MAG: SUKH-3 domain-containing protein [Gammaproteobacteria bacterium]
MQLSRVMRSVGRRKMTSLVNASSQVRELLLAAGWTLGRRLSSVPPMPDAPLVYAILSEFGGLNVGSCGSGLDCTASNVRFFTQRQDQKNVVARAWQSNVGALNAVADAHNEHIIVFIGQDGAYYFFTDPDEKLYFGAKSFGEAMELLLLGKHFGPPIPRDAQPGGPPDAAR